MQTMQLERHQIIHLAAARTEADTRTIAKVIDGKRVKGRVALRIRRALVELGINPPEAK
jgi:hypothetical protein